MKTNILMIPLLVIGLFSCNKNEFTITWVDYDDSILRTDKVKRDATPSFGDIPTRKDDENYIYKFLKWTPDIKPATSDTKYKAEYLEIEKCDVTFKDNNGEILLNTISDVESIKDINNVYTGLVPQKNNEGDIYYYFDSWKKVEESENKKILTYIPTFKTCGKEDDQDHDGVPDYLDPTPLSSNYNITISYAHDEPMKRITLSNLNLDINFESMFINGDINKYNSNLAKLASVLHTNGDITNGGIITINDQIKPRFKYKNIYERLGFSDIELYDLPDTYSVDKYDIGGVMLAHKKYKNNLSNEYKDILFINSDIKYKRETGWYSNFDIGVDDEVYYEKEGCDHDPYWDKQHSNNMKGSYVTARRLYETKIKDYISQYTNPIIFLTGYSRGGAIVNHIAHFLNNEYTDPIKLFTYTLGAPNNLYGDVETNINKNIFNVINEDDVVPYVPLTSWKDENNKSPMKHGQEILYKMSDKTSYYKKKTSLSYEYFKNAINLINEYYTTTRKGIYTLTDSGFSKSFLKESSMNESIQKYKNVLYKIGMTDQEIELYIPFYTTKSNGYKFYNKNCLGSIMKLMSKYMNGGEFVDKDLYFDLFDNYYKILKKLVLKGLTGIEQISYPHYITTYYLLAELDN